MVIVHSPSRSNAEHWNRERNKQGRERLPRMSMNKEQQDISKADILIVDDTPINLQLLISVLSKEGYHVRTAYDGYQALESVEEKLPDLILLDVMMPKMNGYETCQRLKAVERTKNIPIIFLSVEDTLNSKMKAFDIGGVDYVTKPFHSREVVARVETHLNLRGMQQQLIEKNTQLEQTTSKLQRQNAILQAQHEATIDGVLVVDENRHVTYYNRRFLTLWNIPTGIAKSRDDNILVEHVLPVIKYPHEFLEKVEYLYKHSNEMIYDEILLKDGRTIERHSAPMLSPTKENYGRVWYFRDITRRKKTEKTLHQRNRELLLINRVGQMFGSSLELDEVLKTALDEIRQLFDVVGASFWLYNHETDELTCQYANGARNEKLIGWCLAANQGITSWVVKNCKSVIVGDAQSEVRHYKEVDRKIGLKVRSILSMPMWAKGDVIGVLNLVDTVVNRFSNDDLSFLEPIVAAAASAIENARLHTAVQQELIERKESEKILEYRLGELETLNLIMQMMTTVTDFDIALQVVASAIVELLNVSYCDIAILNTNKTIITIVAEPTSLYNQLSRIGLTENISGNSALKEVIKTKQSLILTKHEHSAIIPDMYPVLILPLRTRGEVIGVIRLATDQIDREPLNEEVGLAETIAGQVASAVENVRLFEQEQQQRKFAENLRQVSTVLTQSLDLETVLDTLLEYLEKFVPYDSASVLLLEREEFISIKSIRGYEKWTDVELVQNMEFNAKSVASIWQMLTTHQTKLIPDTNQEPTWQRLHGTDYVRNWLGIPLVIEGEAIGCYSVDKAVPNFFTDEHVQFAETIANSASIAIKNARLFNEVQTANRRMHDELALAHDIQQSLLPPSSPEQDWLGTKLVAYTAPARELGGDFYNYHVFGQALGVHKGLRIPEVRSWESEGKYGIVVGDVSGKGVSAALLMATCLAQLDASFAYKFTPAERFVYLDDAIKPYTKPRNQNCAMCYMELEVELQESEDKVVRLCVVNAGGIPPYIKRKDGHVEWYIMGGFALGQGLGSQLGYEEKEIILEKGDMVILTSDGICEANNIHNNLFGFDRLEKSIKSGPISSANALLSHIRYAVMAFVGEAEPHDDMTIVVIQV